jgi:gliding motility-associated-like protein
VQYNGWVDYPVTGGCFNNPPNVQYSEQFVCTSDMPPMLNLCFRVFENDPFLPCDINAECEESICMDFPIPATNGTFPQTLSLPAGLSSSGTLNFEVTRSGTPADVANDDICAPIDLGILNAGGTLGNSALSNYSNYCATGDNEPNPGDDGAGWTNNVGVWFTFTTGSEQLPYVDVEVLSDPQNLGDPINLQVALYSSSDGTCNGAMTLVDESFSNADYDEVFQTNCLQPNTTYFFLVDGAAFTPDQAVGLFGLSLFAFDVQEGGDLKCDAEDLGTVPDGGFVTTGTPRSNQCASSIGDPFVSAFVSQKSVWFSFMPPLSGHVLIEAISDLPPPVGYNSIDLQLAVYRSNTNACTGFFFEEESVYTAADLDESIELSCLDPTRPYWILVDGAGDDTEGIFTITVTDLGDDTPVFNQDVTICDGDFISVGTSIYSQTGMYADTLSLPGGCDSIVNTNLLVLDPVVASFDIISYATNIGTADGELMGTATGGTGNYSYAWSDGQTMQNATGLIGDDFYCLTVTDDLGCTDDTCFTMPYSTVPIPTITGDLLDCFGDSDGVIEFSVANGQPPYDYNWQESGGVLSGNGTIANEGDVEMIDNLPAGNYSFTITDGVNDTIVSVAITQPTELLVSLINSTDASCFGECDGTISVEASGGTPPYVYSWDSGTFGPDLFALCAGDYEVTVSDANGCETEATYTIDQPIEFTATASVINNVSCFDGADGSVTVTTNGNPISFDWDNGGVDATLIDLEAGIYTVVVTNDDGCQATASVEVLEPSAPVGVNINILEPVTCFGGTDAILEAVPTGPGTSFTFSWTGGGGTNAQTNGIGAGSYTVTVANELGCETSATIVLPEPDEIFVTYETTDVTCLTAEDAGTVTVTSVTGGIEPYMFSLDGDVYTSDTMITGLTAGFYELYVEDAGGCVRTYDATIDGPPDLIVNLGPDQTIELGETVSLSGAGTGNDLVYTWLLPGVPFDCATEDCGTIDFLPIADGIVSVSVLDTVTQCVAADEVFITVNKILNVYAPNVFSPDFDGVNDKFMVFGDAVINRVVTMQVYDRYGALLFSATNFQPGDESYGWDGTVGGQPAQTGVYVYFAEIEFIDGVREIIKGDVLLVR